jgi:hypothetical protein
VKFSASIKIIVCVFEYGMYCAAGAGGGDETTTRAITRLIILSICVEVDVMEDVDKSQK